MTDKRILEKNLRNQLAGIQSRLETEIKPRFATRHITRDSGLHLITGVRGVGKTTLGLHVLKSWGVRFAYVDLSGLRGMRGDEDSLAALLEALCMVYGEFEWLLIDEFLCIEEWDTAIRYFRMMGFKVFGISSGTLPALDTIRSSASMVLYPLSFSEYCLWHDVNTEVEGPVERAALRQAFDDFSMRGGMPENQYRTMVKRNSAKMEEEILGRDIRGDFRKSNLPKIQEIARYLIDHSPLCVFHKEIAERFALRSETTAKKYVGFAKGCGALYPLERFAFQDKIRNYGERLYAVDPCFCHGTDEDEARLKTIVYMQLRRFCERHGYQMHYYGNRDLECDFVLCHEMKMRTIIQVIYDYSDSEAIKEKVSSLISLSSATGCGKLFILTDNCHDRIEVRGLNIYVKPVYEFLLDRSHMII